MEGLIQLVPGLADASSGGRAGALAEDFGNRGPSLPEFPVQRHSFAERLKLMHKSEAGIFDVGKSPSQRIVAHPLLRLRL